MKGLRNRETALQKTQSSRHNLWLLVLDPSYTIFRYEQLESFVSSLSQCGLWTPS